MAACRCKKPPPLFSKILKSFKNECIWHAGSITVAKNRAKLAFHHFRAGQTAICQVGTIDRNRAAIKIDWTLKDKIIETKIHYLESSTIFKSEKYRLFEVGVNCRTLSSSPVKGVYPPPKTDKCLESFGEARFIAPLKEGPCYWIVRSGKTDCTKTPFTFWKPSRNILDTFRVFWT